MSNCTNNRLAESGDTFHVYRKCVNIWQNIIKFTFILNWIVRINYFHLLSRKSQGGQISSQRNKYLKVVVHLRILSIRTKYLNVYSCVQARYMMDQTFSFNNSSIEINQFGFTEQDFDIWLQVIKQAIDTPDDEEALKDLIIEYFKDRIGINIETQYFCRRTQVLQVSKHEIIQNRYILFGVDFLSTSMIKDIFYPNHIHIRWIDDSSCVIFTNSQVQHIFSNLLKPQAYQVVFKHGQSFKQGWHELKSYHVFGIQRKLYLRFSTRNDENLFKSKANSYGQYQYYRKALPMHFLAKYNAIQAFEQAVSKQYQSFQESEETNSIFQENVSLDNDGSQEKQEQIMNISITANIDDFQQNIQEAEGDLSSSLQKWK